MDWWNVLLAAGTAFGVGGFVVAFLDRRHATREAEKTRDHATTEARAVRQFTLRSEGYKVASAYLERVRLWCDWTEPMRGPKPKPPDITTGDTYAELAGAVGVMVSEPALEALRTVVNRMSAFQYAVEEYRDERDNPAHTSWDASDPRSPGTKLHEARQAAFSAITDAQTLMRTELADL